ncbi:hemoglobin [Cytophagales bacterium WSM2-2]|nr:hemoglobin [Cytophagales bacterium WSM2-2]
MTPKQIELIEDSWDFILMNTDEAGIIFYKRLFELNPALRPLFKEDIKSQAQKLVSLITFAVHKLNNFNEIVSDVKALGLRHKGYKVKPEYYITVAEALLWTLESGLGNEWNEEVKEAWIKLYETLSKIMLEAYNS